MSETFVITMTLVSGFLIIYHHLLYPLILRWLRAYRAQSRITPLQRES